MNGASISVVAFAAAFLIGSIPFGYVIGRLFYRTDIRKEGSGNIGAMNALRTLGKGGAIAVLLLDALKGYVPALLALLWFPANHVVAALAATGAVLGHCYSPWLRFKGGKGVATALGAAFALSWPAGLVVVAGWAAGALLTSYSSVGSMLGCALAPIALFLFTRSLPETAFGIFAAVLVVLKHRDNIGRLRAGTEGPIPFLKRQKGL